MHSLLFYSDSHTIFTLKFADVATVLLALPIIVLWRFLWRHIDPLLRVRNRIWVMAAAGMLLVAVANIYFGENEFDGYDPSPTIHAAWNILCGQLPVRDFICTFPPIAYLPAVVGFHLLGVHWISLLTIASAICLLCAAGGARLLFFVRDSVRTSQWNAALLTYLGSQAALLLVVNIPWHSTLTAAFNCYLAVATLILIAAPDLPRSRRVELWAHYVMVCGVLVLGKPNTAYPAIALSSLALVAASRDWKRVLAPVAALGAASLMLAPFHITLLTMWQGYLGLEGRTFPSYKVALMWVANDPHLWWGMAVLLAYLFAAPGVLCIVQSANQELRGYGLSWSVLFVVGMGAICLYGVSTNLDAKITDIAPFLCTGMVSALWFRVDTSALMRRMLLTMALSMLAATFLCVVRWRQLIGGPWGGPMYGQRVLLHDEFFNHLEGRSSLVAVLTEVDRALREHPHASVFFGTRMEFLYARNQVLPPLHLPLWWDPGSSYPLRSQQAVVAAFQQDHPSLVILNTKDTARMPASLVEYIQAAYERESGYRAIDVYRLR